MPTIYGPRGRARRLFGLAVALPLLLNLAGGAAAAPYLSVDLATGAAPTTQATEERKRTLETVAESARSLRTSLRAKRQA